MTFEQLSAIYPCLIDCRGAPKDKKLKIPGENSVGVVSASIVYKIYNDEFVIGKKRGWPFALRSVNPILGIIGGGDASADVARMFLKDPSAFKNTPINPRFLAYLRRGEGPSAIRIFIRGNPADCKMTLKELNELGSIANLCAYYDDTSINVASFNQLQRDNYAFFSNIKNKEYSEDKKIIYFHFQMVPKNFRQLETQVEATFIKNDGTEEAYRVSNYVVSIGCEAAPEIPGVYRVGWSKGKGGKLSSAEADAIATAKQIETDYHRDKFVPRPDSPINEAWKSTAPISNQDFKNILSWLKSSKQIDTNEELQQAKHYAEVVNMEHKKPPAEASPAKKIEAKTVSGCITVIDGTTEKEMHLPVNDTLTVLGLFKSSKIAPPHECDGQKTCGQCVVNVDKAPKAGVNLSAKEKFMLEAGGNSTDGSNILSCFHNSKDYDQSILSKNMKV